MKHLLIFLSLVLNLFGYDYFQTSNPNISIANSSYYLDNQNLEFKDMLKLYHNDKFKLLVGKSYSKGFTQQTAWVYFEVKSQSEDEIFIKNNILQIEHIELYQLINNQTIKTNNLGRNKYLFPLNIKKDTSNRYLIKIKTHSPMFITFTIDTKENIYQNWDFEKQIYMLMLGFFIALLLYNLFLFFMLKESVYIFYILMGLAYFSIHTFVRFGILLGEFYFEYNTLFAFLFFSMYAIFTYLFTCKFLNLKKEYPKLTKYLDYYLIFSVSMVVLIYIIAPTPSLIIILLNIFLILLLGIAKFKSYYDGNKFALFFIIATGVQIFSMLIMPIVIFGKIELDFFTFSIPYFGLLWDMLFLSFALAYKQKELQKENNELDKLLLIQSRQATFGTMIDTISHQWKQPINELGLQMMIIDTKLKLYNQVPTKEELETTIEKSNNILEFMSTTIDIFRNFFKTNEKVTQVDISNTLKNTILFLESTFEADNIDIKTNIEPNITIEAKEEEFAHSILNILVNAKDIFKQKVIKDPKIEIKLYKKGEKVYITIQDNGGGIDLNPIEKIFASGVSTKANGGIGMYITKKIICDKLGGSISVENINDGARFEIGL